MSTPHYEYDNAFLVAAHDSMDFGGSIRGKVKSSSIAYNRRETRNKRPVGWEPDRSWCHLLTGVKLFWSQLMASWISAAAYECAAAQSMDPWAAIKNAS